MFNEFLLIFITIFIVISGFLIIYFNNMIYSLILLILVFVLSSFILLLMDCEFLAFVFLLIYIGGIMILFIFAIILLDYNFKQIIKNTLFSFVIIYFIVILFLILFFVIKLKNILFLFSFNFYLKPISFINWKLLLNYSHKINIYSIVLYSNFFIEFILIGLILLLILIGIVFLCNNYLSLNIKTQINFKQFGTKSNFYH